VAGGDDPRPPGDRPLGHDHHLRGGRPGRGGCNPYFGTATVEGERVSFGPLGATKMACPPALMDQERRFFAALEGAERWALDDGGLFLLYAAGAAAPSRFASFEE
jgi:putative lipoprotein